MFYIIFSAIAIIWFIIIKVKGNLSWHAVFSIVFITLIVTDIPDIALCYVLHLFSLYLKFFENTAIDIKNALLISNLVILPIFTVIFCYYFAKYRKWWIPVVYPVILTTIEILFVHFKYIEYHNFHPLYTFTFYVIGTAVLCCVIDRLINYSPPISFTIMIIPAAYVIMAFPGTIFGTLLQLFLWGPGVFGDIYSDNWVVAVSLGFISGLVCSLGFLIFKSKKSRNWVIISVGFINIAVSFVLFAKGMLIFYKWNSIFQTLMFVSSTILLLLYNLWESKYREGLKVKDDKRFKRD